MPIMFYFTILKMMQAKTFLSRTPATVFSDPHPPSLRPLNHSYILESDLSVHLPPGINCILVYTYTYRLCVAFQVCCSLSDLSVQMPS